jgi:hypothetical protein
MSYHDVLKEDQRLTLLIGLTDMHGYSANQHVLQGILAKFAHHCSSDKLSTELVWLEEQGLVRLGAVAGCKVATLTQRGLDVAEGRASQPGVKRRAPDL